MQSNKRSEDARRKMTNPLLDFGADPDSKAAGNAPAMTVSELSNRVKRTVEDAYGRVRVRGELGRVSRPRSGHIYLDLKDDRAVLAGVVWKGVADKLSVRPEEGLEVIAEGRLTTFPGQSRYQIVIESLTPAGAGALMAMLVERKKRLAAEGLFAPERKKPLPFLPDVIGVVTSPSGAVIRDILHRLRDRFPRHVLIWPVAVQGAACSGEVARAIRGFNALPIDGAVPRPDVLIVARGGGSVEDLWGFNEEEVVRAAAASAIPVIAAVGHETDTSLIDDASDMRAPTPTAAAEMAVPVRDALLARLADLEARRLSAMRRWLEDRRRSMRDLARALPNPEGLIEPVRQRLDVASERLPLALRNFGARLDGSLGRIAARLSPTLLKQHLRGGEERLHLFANRLAPALVRGAAQRRDRFERGRFDLRIAAAANARLKEETERLVRLGRLLNSLSYKATLARGYVAVRNNAGVIAVARDVAAGEHLRLEFSDGEIAVVADGKPVPPKRKEKTKAVRSDDDPQGRLL